MDTQLELYQVVQDKSKGQLMFCRLDQTGKKVTIQVTVLFSDPATVAGFVPGKQYEIVIREIQDKPFQY